MKIVKPNVTFWRQNENVNAHVAKCARVCYASEKEDDCDKLVDNLMTKKHYSMFRHESCYFIVDLYTSVAKCIINNYENCPYIEFEQDNKHLYVATNKQFLIEHGAIYISISQYKVSPEEFANTKLGFNLMRFTFNVITQISTSRELNRVSPNNIAEQSTRYCNYSRGKFEGECAICQPHWFDLGQKEIAYYKYTENGHMFALDDKIWHPYQHTHIVLNKYKDNPRGNIMFQRYMLSTAESCNEYLKQINDGMLPQDARGQLPLDLATECVYTYSIKEWRHILDLRYYGISGAPHPNAKIIAGIIRERLINLGYAFR